MYKGRITTIEGLDAAGKKTQAKMLVNNLMMNGFPVKTMSFPRYETPTGRKVRAYLNGEYGSLDQVDPKFASRLYADDRLAAKPEVEGWLLDGGIWVFDRYYESNLGHQGAKFRDPEEKQAMVDYLLNLELKKMRLPPSDFVIYLSLPLDYILEAKAKDGSRAGIKDLHEDDMDHLRAAKETYDVLASQLGWKTIGCYNSATKSRHSMEVIQSMVLSATLDYLHSNYMTKAL
ncbi:Thymidylate kinase [uncultured archaeon]|nr:Thymidylate kinase [uncultured archaeon]